MLRSLFSAISGLRANQTMLDVTGNNIANANTVGFKASSVVFQDTLSQMLTAAGGPVAQNPGPPAVNAQGGTNPIQIGLGVQVGGVTTNFTQGGAQETGQVTNLMISGDGFFVVQRDGNSLYTRAGAFNWDADGNLVTPDGDIVMGYPAAADGSGTIDTTAALVPITFKDLVTDPAPVAPETSRKLVSYSIGGDGIITGVYSTSDGTTTTSKTEQKFQIALANFVNPAGMEKVGDTAYVPTANSGQPDPGVPGTGQLGALMGGRLEMSNVDLAQEFTNLIIAQRGFQATSRVITTSDEVLQELVNLKR